ncbi:glycosyltransferase family 8 protein [Mucilaginibacter sp.]|uniref:glycosyltransferase family 8 protein n=1 Tax=Mucilaginibacter sp. TaxID=1882438 RepID=UPI003D0C46D1
MNKRINVFFSIDENYIQHFTVAVTSLLENNCDILFDIYVIHNIRHLQNIERVSHFLLDTYNVELKLINIANVDFSRFTTNDNYTSATYFRLFLPDIIPASVNGGLFLDSDIVVTGSIKNLIDIEIADHYIFAASEAFVAHNTIRLNKLGFNLKDYFNAGVMLINLQAWRQGKLTEKFLQIADEYMQKFEWYDQDILNVFFANNWGHFDRKFNAVHLQNEQPEIPVIVHFASFSKPWHYVDTHPYKYLYLMYLRLTPFRKSKPTGFSIMNFILKNGRLFKRRLRKAGIIK